MTTAIKQFTNHLDSNHYSYTIENGIVTIDDKGYEGGVNLDSLTTLPEGVVFNNKGSVWLNILTTLPEGVVFNNKGSVLLKSLTTLPEGVVFNNKGGVWLDNLTTLPEGVVFNNKGSVWLDNLTTLPEGVVFNNKGGVWFDSLTTLPEGVVFNNEGGVWLNNLTTLPEGVVFNNKGGVFLHRPAEETQTYLGKTIRIKWIDGSTMLIENTKVKDGIAIHKCRYFGGGDIDKLEKCFVVESGELSAHGKTLKEALEDLSFKVQENVDIQVHVEEILKTQLVTITQYRHITGACREGIRHFLEENDLPQDVESIPLDKVKDLIKGKYGADKFLKLVG
jgi:hypothetical protein